MGKKLNLSFVYLYGIALFLYILYRAIHLSFTFDEVTTVQIAQGEDWNKIALTANNHFLNVVLIKLNMFFFEANEWVYRLPNVLSFILYLIYSFKIGKLLVPKYFLAAFILLTSMPFLLDFFSLARGYGLALSFIISSAYYLVKYCNSQRLFFGLSSLFLGVLAVLSNFTSLNYFIPLLFILLTYTLINKNNRKLNLSLIIGGTSLFLFLIFPVLLELKNSGEFYFGGRSDFVTDTIFSLARCFAYFQLNISFAQIIFLILFLMAVSLTLWKLTTSILNKELKGELALGLLFVLSILSPISQNILFNNNFPVERTALIYYPLLVLTLLSFLEIIKTKAYKIFIISLSFCFFLQNIYTSNTRYSYSWRFDAGTKGILKHLQINNTSGDEVSLGIDYIFLPSTWFYRSFYGFHELSYEVFMSNWNFPYRLEELDPYYFGAHSEIGRTISKKEIYTVLKDQFDYYYISKNFMNALEKHKVKFKVIRRFDTVGSYLITVK